MPPSRKNKNFRTSKKDASKEDKETKKSSAEKLVEKVRFPEKKEALQEREEVKEENKFTKEESKDEMGGGAEEFFSGGVPRVSSEEERPERIDDILGIPISPRRFGAGGVEVQRRAGEEEYDERIARGRETRTSYAPATTDAYSNPQGMQGQAGQGVPFYGAATEYSQQNYSQGNYSPSTASSGRDPAGELERRLPSVGAAREEIPSSQQETQIYQERVDVRELLDLDTPTEKRLKKERRIFGR